MTASARLALVVLRAYQLVLAPFAGGACRFHPSCSEYAAEAVATHGALRGAWITCRRLTRCHPWASFGIDPVPPREDQPRGGRE